MKYQFIFLLVIMALVSGCSVLPYEEDFACSRNATYGKCTNVEGAYNEAITGVSAGATINKDGVMKEERKKNKKQKDSDEAMIPEGAAYSNYRAEMYSQLSKLVAAPETPIVKKAVETRTLIMSYSPNSRKDRLYMPRFVYSIHQPAEFVIGQYRLESDPSMKQINDFINRSSTNTDKQ